MKKINIKLVWKKIRHSFKEMGSDADKDWKIALSIFVVILIASIIFHVDILVGVETQKTGSVKTESATKVEFVNARTLNDVLSQYDRRAKEYQKLQSAPSTLVDPAK
ncbi:MAG TPA: hypothetical protein VJH63_00710 [Candidatus Paceibacterota bacterium]